ncbi:RNA-binding protein Musashi -like protein 2 [Trichinella pseudospiralis]|uniref:RNA-binding protein Musashi-like protein 2 n=1 Tax=Trichinella pseudospiralis TaxID=6337 RepID=A0A0V1KFS3_TRIPS|nr:RNA-binding protein Musashi -like protein 2 [Trichinella pseudospiralis]
MSSENLSSPASETVEAIEDPGKMFIGGLSWQTSVDSLRQYFMQFGEVTESVVMRDPNTKKARGFGFIKFADAASVDKVLNHQAHELDGKKIDPKVAFPKRIQPKNFIVADVVLVLGGGGGGGLRLGWRTFICISVQRLLFLCLLGPRRRGGALAWFWKLVSIASGCIVVGPEVGKSMLGS